MSRRLPFGILKTPLNRFSLAEVSLSEARRGAEAFLDVRHTLCNQMRNIVILPICFVIGRLSIGRFLID
jgi:hypothetical protein